MLSDFPIRVTIEPTNHCNLNCLPCPRHYITMPMGFMDWGLFLKIIKQIRNPGTDIILAWRGEPTLHLNLYGMAYRSPVPVVIATNGTIPRNIPIELIKAINVSIHNDKSLTGLTLITGNKPPQLKITASQVEGEIPDALWRQVKAVHGVDEFRTYQEHSAGGVWGAIKSDSNKRFNLQGERQGLCHRLETDLVIAWDGSISRCCYKWTPDFPDKLNANNMTLKEIWHSPELQGIRDRYPDHICSRCDQWRSYKTL